MRLSLRHDGQPARQLLLRLHGEEGRSTPLTNRPVVVIAGSPEELSAPEADQLGAVNIYYPPLDIEPLALDLFSIVAGWRLSNPNELWADEAAQSHD